MMKRAAALIIGLAFGLCAVQAMARNGQYLFREMARYQVPSGAAPALTASLLLHFDEANGSSNIVDSGKYGLAVQSLALAQTTNSPQKFGNVASFGVSGKRFDAAWTNDFRPGTNNWSIDCWIQSDATGTLPANQRYICGNDTANLRTWIVARRSTTPNYRFDLTTNGTTLLTTTFAYNAEAVSNAWLHIALWRFGNSLYAATNGVLVTLSSTNVAGYDFSPTNTTQFRVGASSGSSVGFSFIDEFRYCVGSSMPYGTTNFTPPSAAYTGYE